MTKQEMLDQLQGPGSVDYTFMPVIKVIEMLEQLEDSPSKGSVGPLTEEQMKELASEIANDVARLDTELLEDYDLTMNYREVEIDSVSIDEDRIKNVALHAIESFFEAIVEEE